MQRVLRPNGGHARGWRMIWESGPWRDELMRAAARLEGRGMQKRWSERASFLVERDIMVSAYAVRKLSEAQKLSTAFESHEVPLLGYPLKGSPPDQQNWYHIDRFYDLDAPQASTLMPREVCNQIIHSRVFMVVSRVSTAKLWSPLVAN